MSMNSTEAQQFRKFADLLEKINSPESTREECLTERAGDKGLYKLFGTLNDYALHAFRNIENGRKKEAINLLSRIEQIIQEIDEYEQTPAAPATAPQIKIDWFSDYHEIDSDKGWHEVNPEDFGWEYGLDSGYEYLGIYTGSKRRPGNKTIKDVLTKNAKQLNKRGFNND
jgi:hypothetical protein